MSTTTTLLSLLKKNPVTDASDTFNFDIILNNNWDILEAWALKNDILKVTSKSANATLTNLERGIIGVTTGASTITITLPTAVTAQISYLIKKIDSGAGTVTISTTSSQLIDGVSAKSITVQNGYIQVVSDGTGWQVVDGNSADFLVDGTTYKVYTATEKTKLGLISAQANKTTVTTPNSGAIEIDGVSKTIYTHPSTDGNHHVPATSTTHNGQFLKSGATAGSEAWAAIVVSDVSGALASSSYTAADILAKLLTVDGAGSGLDADTLDALSSAAFLQLTGGQTLSGFMAFARNELRQPKLKDYSEVLTTNATATGAVTIDLSTANNFDLTLTGATTLTFSNPAPSGQTCSFTLLIRQGGTAYAVTYPASVKWSNDVIPDISAINKTSVLTFLTVNGGTRWYGFLGANGLVT